MKAMITSEGGIDGLKAVDRSRPAVGPSEVRIRVRATSLNYRDLVTVKNARAGLVPNSCGAGEIVEVGSAVSRFRIGDRVTPTFFQRWLAGPITAQARDSALGGSLDGCLQEEMVLDESGVLPIPEYMTFEEAATLPCAALTAWRALAEEGRVGTGQTVLVQGTGGVSVFALQLARLAGAEVIVTSSSDDKLERARALGAHHTINYVRHENWAARARELTDGRGVDHVVEVGGAGTLGQSIEAVAFDGDVHVIGVLSGFVKDIPIASIFRSNARLRGITVGSRLMFENMLRAMTLHELHPVIDRTCRFEETRDAFALMERGGHFGKIVITL